MGAKLKPDVGMGFIYLSGDDASTPDLEHWDPLFSRYPWISEFYYVPLANERGVAYWTNLSAWQASVKLTLSQATNLTLWYNYLRANENVAGAFFGTGKTRGHLPQIRVNHRFNKYLDGYVLYEHFIPGDFHSAAAQDTGMFLRAELQLKF